MSEGYGERRRKLLESKPSRDGFLSEEEYEEALGYWHHHQGRILRLLDEQDYMRRHEITFEEMVALRSRGDLNPTTSEAPDLTPDQTFEEWEM